MSDYDADAVIAAGPQQPGSLDLCPNCRGAWHGLPWLGCAGSHEGAALPPQIDAEPVSDPETSVGPIPTYETRQRAAQPDLADSYQSILDHAYRAIRHLLGFAWAGLDDNPGEPMTDKPDIVQRAEQALDGITPGPWLHADSSHGRSNVISNADFIAAAPELVRELLAAVKRLTADLDAAAYRAGQQQSRLADAQAWAEWFAAERDWIKAHFAATYVWQQNVEATIERVRMLHSKRPIAPGCMACDEPHPCATIRAMGVCRLLGYRWTTPEVAPLHTESICTSDLGSACLNELCPHRVCTTCRQKWPCEGSGKR